MTELFLNPYVIQMDKFADSLIHLSRTFLSLESYKGTFSKEEFEEMFVRITDQVCGECEKRKRCLQENRVYTYQLMYEILCGVEEYGAELSTELKRKLIALLTGYSRNSNLCLTRFSERHPLLYCADTRHPKK